MAFDHIMTFRCWQMNEFIFACRTFGAVSFFFLNISRLLCLCRRSIVVNYAVFQFQFFFQIIRLHPHWSSFVRCPYVLSPRIEVALFLPLFLFPSILCPLSWCVYTHKQTIEFRLFFSGLLFYDSLLLNFCSRFLLPLDLPLLFKY